MFEPVLLSPGERQSDEQALQQNDRLVLFMDEPQPEVQAIPVPGPEALLLMQEPLQERLIIPKATRPPPQDKQQEFMNDLPFSEGNTDEFVTDEELEDPGDEGEPGEPEDEPVDTIEESDTNGTGEDDTGVEEGLSPDDLGKNLAELLPKDPKFSYFDPDFVKPDPPEPVERAPAPQPAPRRYGEGGQRGGGGAFEDIRRFLAESRFHNPEGGLVTGKSNTLYYNDKGANFVPWLRRLLEDVRRNWFPPYSASFLAGHVAVGISVNRNGDIEELEILIPSQVSGFDNAAVGALRAADLMPLPADYPDERFEIIIVFWYNERPYDLF
jgi:TonB family protein